MLNIKTIIYSLEFFKVQELIVIGIIYKVSFSGAKMKTQKYASLIMPILILLISQGCKVQSVQLEKSPDGRGDKSDYRANTDLKILSDGLALSKELFTRPLIERVVNNEGTGKDFFIDFETGKIFSPPEQWQGGSNPFEAWLKENGIDAMGAAGGRENIKGLACFDMIVIPVDNPSWSEPNKAAYFMQFLDKGKAGSPVFMTGKGELPVTYMFKTREGGIGILQITGFSEEPKGTKIKYRILGKEQPSNPAGQAQGE